MRDERSILREAGLALLLAAAGSAAAETASLTVPIVLSTAGLAGSFYTSEMALTNRGTTPATITFTYTAAFGGGGGTGTDTLAAGRQKVVPDAIAYLIERGVPIAATGGRGGVLRVDFDGLSRADAAAVTVRTTTAVPNGRAGLAYSAFADGIDGSAYLCGLRQDATDRSNVALLNAGAPDTGDIVLRVTAFSGDPAAPKSTSLPDVTLRPGGFVQFTEMLKQVALTKGWVRIDRISGRAPYYAYATILDQITSDGSFVPPLTEDAVYSGPSSTLAVAVETGVFTTEVVLTNVSDIAKDVQLAYVADAVTTADHTATLNLTLAPREQKVIPSLVQFLRDRSVAGVGGLGPTFAGAVYLKVLQDDTGGVFLGGRTQTTGSGRFGLFYTAQPDGTNATENVWVYGLQQNGENRTNLAFVNTGETDGSGVTLRVDLHDGTTGQVARSFDVSLAAKRWTQVNTVLAPGIANGFARVTRTAGSNPFLAYGVVVDGGQPGSGRSDDGAFVSGSVEAPPDSPEIAAIRKVEAKYIELRAGGTKRLDLVRAIAAYMATLPEYDFVDTIEKGLTAFGVFKGSGRVHIVADNRELDAGPHPQPPPAGRRLGALAGKTELPEQPWARLLHSFGDTAFTQEPIYDLAAWLEDPGGYGIRPGKRGDARLSVLRSIGGDGFFYFNTHGGPARKTRASSGQHFYSLQSSTLCSTENDRIPEIKADLDAGLLTYFTEQNFRRRVVSLTGRTVDDVDTRYGITADFVRLRWHDFSKDSVVFLNACFSTRTDPGTLGNEAAAVDFINAVLSKKVDVYFGWDDLANSGTCYQTVRFFVDRLIGANKFQPESPKQRAFPWELVYQDLVRAGLSHDSATGADLTFYTGAGDSSVILDSSIKEMLVNEYDETLIIKGSFGTRQGKVTIGPGDGLAMDIKSWDWDQIVCNLDRTGPRANGDVTVQVPGAYGAFRKSNVHQLTEWNIPLHYFWPSVLDIAGLKIEGTGKLRFRGDVGSFREKPHEPPTFPFRSMVPTKDSQLPLTAAGSGPVGDCTGTLVGGTVTFKSETAVGTPAGVTIAAAAKVDANTPHLGAVGLGFGILAGTVFQIQLSGGPKCTGSIPVPLTFGELDGQNTFPQEGGFPDIPLFALNVTFDGQFHIPAKSHPVPDLGVIVEWTTDVIPTPPVRFDTAR